MWKRKPYVAGIIVITVENTMIMIATATVRMTKSKGIVIDAVDGVTRMKMTTVAKKGTPIGIERNTRKSTSVAVIITTVVIAMILTTTTMTRGVIADITRRLSKSISISPVTKNSKIRHLPSIVHSNSNLFLLEPFFANHQRTRRN
jgi:hypothetical protein